MFAIYENANQTVVWLGEAHRYTRLAAQYLQWMCTESIAFTPDHSTSCIDALNRIVDGVEDLCKRDGVRRIWVKQEVWASHSIQVLCGTVTMSWKEFIQASTAVDIIRGNWCRLLTSKKPWEPSPSGVSEAQDVCMQRLRRRNEPMRSEPGRRRLSESTEEPHEILKLLNSHGSGGARQQGRISVGCTSFQDY